VNRHQAYEALKRQWLAANPRATPEKVEQAMQAIARRVGL